MKNKKLIISILMASIMIGCVDINLKSELSKYQYYDLALNHKESKCIESKKNISLPSIKIASQFDTQNILELQSDTLISSKLPNAKWISSPKNMYRASAISFFQSRCIQISNSVKDSLYIEILRFESIIEDGNKYAFVYVNATYKSKNITSKQKIKIQDDNFALAYKDAIDKSLEEILAIIS